MRKLGEVGARTKFFAVQGYEGLGFYWLEYHLADRMGGGAFLLHHLGTRRLKGLITAGHCDTSILICYINQWTKLNSEEVVPEYKAEWQHELGEVQ